MLGEYDRHETRTSELHQDLGAVGRLEHHGDVACPLLIQEVDEAQKDPGIGHRQDVRCGKCRLFRADDPFLADPGSFRE